MSSSRIHWPLVTACVSVPGCHTNFPGMSVQRYMPSSICETCPAFRVLLMLRGMGENLRTMMILKNNKSPIQEIKNFQINVTLLSVWSPSWTFRISLDLTCPVAAARNWTREVLPQPIGPSSNTGLWEARARASLLRLWQVESTSTKSFGFVC